MILAFKTYLVIMLGSARVENEFMFRHIQVRGLDLCIDNAEKSPLFYIHTYVRKNEKLELGVK